MSTEITTSSVACVAFVWTAVTYSYANRGRLILSAAVLGVIVFLAAGAGCLWALAWPDHPVLFALSCTLLVGLPALCLTAFGLDVAFGLFMLDMSFAVGVAWLFGSLLFLVTLGTLIVGVLT